MVRAGNITVGGDTTRTGAGTRSASGTRRGRAARLPATPVSRRHSAGRARQLQAWLSLTYWLYILPLARCCTRRACAGADPLRHTQSPTYSIADRARTPPPPPTTANVDDRHDAYALPSFPSSVRTAGCIVPCCANSRHARARSARRSCAASCGACVSSQRSVAWTQRLKSQSNSTLRPGASGSHINHAGPA